MRLFLIAAACVSALATSALAQSAPMATDTAQRQAQAEQMIAAANAAGIFVFEDNGRAVAIRHPRSGLLCRFAYGAEEQELSIIPSTSLGVAHGDDVACGTTMRTGATTIYATRRSDVTNGDEALAAAVGALQRMNPNARPVTLTESDTRTLQGMPLPEGSRTAAFIMPINGQDVFTRVSVYVRNGWVYKLRFTSPMQRANAVADVVWATALNDLPPAESAN